MLLAARERSSLWKRLVPGRRFMIGGGVALGLVVIGLVAFGPIVRGRIEEEAERRRLDVTVGSVRPGFFTVVLGDVTVKPKGLAGIAVHAEDVRVDLSAGLSVREVRVRGGKIDVDGEPEELADRVRAWRKEGATGEATAASS